MRDRGIEWVIAVLEVVGLSYAIVAKGEFVPWPPSWVFRFAGVTGLVSVRLGTRPSDARISMLFRFSLHPCAFYLNPWQGRRDSNPRPPD